MDTDTITTNTSDDSCSGTVRVSNDNFDTCVQMTSGNPSASNGNKTFTFNPSSSMAKGDEYKVRVTTGVEDASGKSLSTQIEITFTTSG